MKRIFLIFSVWSATELHAQVTADTATLEPVEVRAVRAPENAPFAKSNISRKDIERQNLGQDLPFLLNQLPSVVVNSDAGNGVGYTGIRIRGTDATRINVTLNGIPYNDAESQGTFFVDLPDFASSVNSIQVQRGVGTSTNGAGAFGATINFSSNEVNRHPYTEINNSFGSFNTWKNTMKTGTGLLGKHFMADLRLSRISSDGYIDRAFSRLRSLYFSTAWLSQKTDLRFNLILGKERTYQAWDGVPEWYLKENRTMNSAGTERPGAPYDNETDNYWQDHYQFFVTHRFSPSLTGNVAAFLTKGKGYYEQYKAHQDYTDYGSPYPVRGTDTVYFTDLVRQLWLDNDFYGSIFSLQQKGKNHALTFGGAITGYNGRHFGDIIWASEVLPEKLRWYQLKAFKNDANVYGKWQQELCNRLQIFADLQYRLVRHTLHGFRDHPSLDISKHYGFFNPKLGLTWIYKTWQAYASVSAAGKEPNRDDFEAGALEQPRPEFLHDLEAGFAWKKAKQGFSANFYYMHYRDQLVLTGKINDVGAYTRTNIPRSYRMGIELQGNASLGRMLSFSANLSLSRNRILDFTEYLDDYDLGTQKVNQYRETDISYSPSITGAATITFLPEKHVSIDLLSKYVGSQYLDNTSNRNRMLDPYFTEDMRVIYSFKKGALKNASVILQLNNIFNEMYEPNGYTFSYYYGGTLTTENYYSPMAGRNGMAGINLKF